MSRIKTITTDNANGIRRFLLWVLRKKYGGFVPGIMRITLVDLKIGRPSGSIYQYLHLRKKSPISRIQREMIATVVNGTIGGAP